MNIYDVDLEIEGITQIKASNDAAAIKKANAVAKKLNDNVLSIYKELVAPIEDVTDGEFIRIY